MGWGLSQKTSCKFWARLSRKGGTQIDWPDWRRKYLSVLIMYFDPHLIGVACQGLVGIRQPSDALCVCGWHTEVTGFGGWLHCLSPSTSDLRSGSCWRNWSKCQLKSLLFEGKIPALCYNCRWVIPGKVWRAWWGRVSQVFGSASDGSYLSRGFGVCQSMTSHSFLFACLMYFAWC